MQHFQEWLSRFVRGKGEVTAPQASDQFAIHSIRRFHDGADRFWEIAFTYTGRLVVRAGRIEPDGVTVSWCDWTTEHDVQVSKLDEIDVPGDAGKADFDKKP